MVPEYLIEVMLALRKYKERKRTIIGVFLVFCYIFSFYIVGSITSSMMAAALILPYYCSDNGIYRLKNAFCHRYFAGLFGWLVFMMCMSIAFPCIIHSTYDLSYTKGIVGNIVQLICGVLIVHYMYDKLKTDFQTLLKLIILAYILQSVIQIAASFTPQLASFVSYFSRSEEIQEGTAGVRGLALSASTGWNLALSYGIVGILYSYFYFTKKCGYMPAIGWALLTVGCFFAGRTGLVGILVGLCYLILSGHSLRLFGIVCRIIVILLLLIALVCALFPSYVEYAVLYLLPFALEPVINLFENNELSSRSTDILFTMWDRPMNISEFFIGTGYFTGPDGHYYLHTDVGVLRNLFFWGIVGFILLISYQIYLTYPLLKDRNTRLMAITVLGFLALCECKAVAIGFNKFSFSILFLLSSFLNFNRIPQTNHK